MYITQLLIYESTPINFGYTQLPFTTYSVALYDKHELMCYIQKFTRIYALCYSIIG